MNSLFRLTSLLMLSYTLFNLLSTGQISLYINPRFIPLTKFSLAFLLLLSLFSLLQWISLWYSKGRRGSLKIATLIIWLAFLMPLVFPPKMMDSSMAGQKGMMSYQQKAQEQKPSANNDDNKDFQESTDPSIKEPETMPSAPQGDQNPATPDQTQAPPANLPGNNDPIIRFTSENYVELLDDMYNHPAQYLGKELEVDGFIFHPEGLEASHYLIARYAIACCVADAVTVGFVADGEAPCSDNTWVTVRGKLTALDDKGPRLKVTDWEEIPLPPDPYIYAY